MSNIIENTIKNAITKAVEAGATPDGIAAFLDAMHLHSVHSSIPLPGSLWRTNYGGIEESGMVHLQTSWQMNMLSRDVMRIANNG